MSVQVPVRIQTGAPVRIDGKEFSAGPVISGGRVFHDKEAGTQIVLSEVAQMRMALDLRLRDASPFAGLSSARRHALRIDWGTFSPVERKTALVRALYVRKIDKVQPAPYRSKKRILVRIIEEVGKTWNIPLEARPSPRQVRTWYRTFVTTGRDVRGLVPCTWAKGNRLPRYPDWQLEIVHAQINKAIAVPETASLRTVKRLVDDALRSEAAARGESLTLKGRNNTIGGNLIARALRERNKFEILVGQTNAREARRQYHSVQLGPQGDEVNREWEVDHTLLDVFVIDEQTGKLAGRPWLTAIIDRYSRCIVGFSLSFAPPSWASVMDALRVAISRKAPYLRNYVGIKNKWECFGIPATLVMDHGRDFKSNSMAEAARALGFNLRYSKPKKPWLKGKIERWFKTLAEEIVHTLPGTTFSKVEHRKFYDSQKFAVLTIEETNWIVAKWIIDVYLQRRHGKLGVSPAKRWADGLIEIPLLREVPDELLVPMMGLVIPRTLRAGGIRYLGLRWESEAFSEVRAFLPDSANVQVRIDPLDVSTAYVFDERENKWVEGQLVEPVEARGYTLNQWATVKRLRKMIQEQEDKDADEALDEAIADIREYVDRIRRSRDKSKAPNRLARFQNRTAWSAIRPSRDSDDHAEPGSHVIGLTKIQSPPLQPHAPYEERPPRKRRSESNVEPLSVADSMESTSAGNAEHDGPRDHKPTAVDTKVPTVIRDMPPDDASNHDEDMDEADLPSLLRDDDEDDEVAVRPPNYGETEED
ncbi:DDE-type integrase/transposase/recombinase [Bradyrhizobium uaiense]|uniref:DDE-type integrase/transposase/recombinase n=2 Tax=Bradyrhizobium uaiense TaxID=2594946 RepID=A0A6P1BK19_9BRAD|nr:DDE-type integrase/transposase/recombinase [Bradyrhizobium uaiense]NEU97990.1 DDE-type integrase/transposase/recombinase [Bradyrhizobium uaiense]